MKEIKSYYTAISEKTKQPLHPEVASFRLGRGINALTFYLRQGTALSGPVPEQLKNGGRRFLGTSGSVLSSLTTLIMDARLTDRPGIESHIQKTKTDLAALFARHNEIFDELEELARTSCQRSDEPIDFGQELNEMIDEYLDPILKPLRSMLWDNLPEDHRSAFELGEVLDEGARRPDIVAMMRRDHRQDCSQSLIENTTTASVVEEVEWSAGGTSGLDASAKDGGVYYLVRTAYQAGEIPPSPSWYRSVRTILRRFAWSASLEQDFQIIQVNTNAQPPDAAGFKAEVERLDKGIEHRLEHPEESPNGARNRMAYELRMQRLADKDIETLVNSSFPVHTPIRSPQALHKAIKSHLMDNSVFICLDGKSGIEHFRERLGGNCNSSPIASDGRIYLSNNDGTTFVVGAGTRFKLLGSNDLGERITASPAVLGNQLIYRTDSHLYCIGEGTK